MTLVEDVLGYIDDNWPDGSLPSTVRLVNRADSEFFDRPIRDKKADLQEATHIGVGSGARPRSPIGTSFAYIYEPVVSVRIAGLHEDEFGHVADHAAFRDLVHNVFDAVDAEETYPATTARGEFHTVLIQNEEDLSDDLGDYYLTTFDLQFRGYTE